MANVNVKLETVEGKEVKTKYTVIIDGKELSKTSKKEFSHMVAVNNEEKGWLYVGFTSRLDLAEKKKKEFAEKYDEIIIVELVETEEEEQQDNQEESVEQQLEEIENNVANKGYEKPNLLKKYTMLKENGTAYLEDMEYHLMRKVLGDQITIGVGLRGGNQVDFKK